MKDKIFRTVLFMYIVIILSGTFFYSSIEQWPIIDALLFSVTVLATVDVTHLNPQTDVGKIFTIIYLLVGVGIFFALVAKIAKVLILDPSKQEKNK